MGLTSGNAHYPASMAAVLEFAWDAGVFRADHIIAALGLTRSTALSALDTLIEIGLIQESRTGKRNRMGRPARHFELQGDAGLAIGIDAGGHRFTAVAADLSGQSLARRHVEVPGYHDTSSLGALPDPEERRRLAFESIDAVLAAADKRRDDVVGVAVGIPAPVDGDGISPPHAPDFWPRMNADLQSTLSAVFPAVRVENDASLAAVAEARLGAARETENFVALLVGRRLGSGVFLDGRLVRGMNGGVGELEALTHVSGIGGATGLGYRAEEWVHRAIADGRVPAEHPWHHLAATGLNAETLIAEASLADPISRPLLEELGAVLGRTCSVVSRFYDPEFIVVCGAMAGGLGEVIQIAREHMTLELELPPPEILASDLAGDVVSLGAVSAAREAARQIVLPLLTTRQNPRD